MERELFFPVTVCCLVILWNAATCSHISPIKTQILQKLGFRDPSLYDQYDIVWLDTSFVTRRKRATDPFLSLGMEMFGRRMSFVLKLENLTSADFETVMLSPSRFPFKLDVLPSVMDCHYRGRVEICDPGACITGRAAISNCHSSGLRGFVRIVDDDIVLQPLPQSVWSNMREALGGHLAKKLAPRDQWDELNELSLDIRRLEPETLPMQPMDSSSIQTILDKYGFERSELAIPSFSSDVDIGPGRVILPVVAYVDTPMATKLAEDYETSEDQINCVLAAFNAVQVLYDDDSFGDVKVRVRIKRVTIDQTGRVFKGEGNAEKYLVDFCDRQSDLLNSADTTNPFVMVALTGIDVFGVLDQVLQDKAYAGISFPSKRVYGVTGLAFTGGTCKAHRNCMVSEFLGGLEHVDTIAHELGHLLGMNHDGTGNTCSSYGGKIMSIGTTKRRIGWSSCSVNSFTDFLQSGKGDCLQRDDSEPSLSFGALTNG